MGRLPTVHPHLSQAFCEGVQAVLDGATIGDNPHPVSSDIWSAWREGGFAVQTPSAWQATTAVSYPQTYTSGGVLFTVHTSGTTGSVPPEQLGGQPYTGLVLDGTVKWLRQGVGTSLDLGCCGQLPAGGIPYIPLDVIG